MSTRLYVLYRENLERLKELGIWDYNYIGALWMTARLDEEQAELIKREGIPIRQEFD